MKKIIVLSIVLLLIQNVNVTASTNVSGFISVNTTWTTAGSPYIVIGNALLSHGYTLTIDPGVVVKFSDSTALQIDGELHAMGSESQHIIFTSNQTSPAAGDWAEIHFADTCTDAVFDVSGNYLSGCIMEYCDVLYGGILHKGEIHIEDASPYISHCRISNSFSHGIYSNNCSYVFEQSVVKNNNNYGLYFLNYCSMNIIGDSIENNTSGGINFYMPKNYNQYTNIKNNYFYGNNGNGAVYGYMNLFNAVISENQFINNAGSAVISGVNSGLVHCIIQCNKFINNSF
jgi:hypothetical protein